MKKERGKNNKKSNLEKKDNTKLNKERKKGYFQKYKNLLFRPGKFIESVKDEKNYQILIRDFTILYILYFVVTIIGQYFIEKPEIISILKDFVAVVISSIVMPLVIAGAIHLGILAFRGKGNFLDTYKTTIYSLSIIIFYSGILVVILSAIWMILPYDTSILKTMQTLDDPALVSSATQAYLSQPGAKLSFIVNIIINILFLLHSFVFLILGLNKYHEISRAKCILSIIIPLVSIAILIFAGYLIIYNFIGIA